MMKFKLTLLAGIFTALVGCAQDSQNLEASQAHATSVAGRTSSSLLICDRKTAQRAEKIKLYAIGAFNAGAMTQAKSDELQKLAAELTACATHAKQIESIAAANENLKQVKTKLAAGVATKRMLLEAEQAVMTAHFCENNLHKNSEIEALVQSEIDSGVKSVVEFAPVLQKRLDMRASCSK